MIIESKFRDFYDCIAKRPDFVDKSFVYDRKTTCLNMQGDKTISPFSPYSVTFNKKHGVLPSEIPFSTGFPFQNSRFHFRDDDKMYGHLAALIVAGKLYPFVWLDNRHHDSFCYDDETIAKFVKETQWGKKEQEVVINQIKFLRKQDFSDLCLKYQAPVLGINVDRHMNRNGNLTLNPRLQDFGFEKVLDPFQTYQLIFGFISNFLVPKPKEPRPITSKQKAAAHGFDTKTSFRKDTPPTRKQKRA